MTLPRSRSSDGDGGRTDAEKRRCAPAESGSGSAREGAAARAPGAPTCDVGETARFAERLLAEGSRTVRRIRLGRRWAGLIELDDVMQTTYIDAFIAFRGGRLTESTIGPWLRRAAENNLRDAIAKLRRARRPPVERRSLRPPEECIAASLDRSVAPRGSGRLPDAESPPGECERREIIKELLDALERLPRRDRDAIDLTCLRGLSQSKAARALGQTRGAVALICRRACAKLATQIGAGAAREAARCAARGRGETDPQP
ncbi:MAG TPA: sigma-70 family RNA polymerase sigma factor [Phycisphaerales bacterium]|nr:sigma-70 family RNA polymerase sigma factor [Phycisphaerales bacterium]HMP36984.1 sigma-70 family RNA polymerase sigma factor [Phycisphaerales bacterium]